jgi:hypothetical protein
VRPPDSRRRPPRPLSAQRAATHHLASGTAEVYENTPAAAGQPESALLVHFSFRGLPLGLFGAGLLSGPAATFGGLPLPVWGRGAGASRNRRPHTRSIAVVAGPTPNGAVLVKLTQDATVFYDGVTRVKADFGEAFTVEKDEDGTAGERDDKNLSTTGTPAPARSDRASAPRRRCEGSRPSPAVILVGMWPRFSSAGQPSRRP